MIGEDKRRGSRQDAMGEAAAKGVDSDLQGAVTMRRA